MKTLFKNCYVLTGHEINFTSLVVDNDKISYIGDNPEEYDCVRDMNGCLLMPGLVDAHSHGPMTLIRGLGSGLKLQDWLNKVIVPIEEYMTPDDIYIGEQWAIVEMLAAGITTTSEMYDFPWRTWEALLDSGMKANICRAGISFSEEEEIPKNRLQECEDFVKNFSDPTNKLMADFCIHAEYSSTEKFVRKLIELNKKYKVSVHIHASETKKEHDESKLRHDGLSPIQYFNKLGLFDNNCYAAHCVWVDDEDLRIMKEKNVTIVHNPSSNMKLGSGFAPIRKAIDMGINVALGTDGVASNDVLSIFKEMHLAALIHNGYNKNSQEILPKQVVDMGTINGAKALGRNDTGILEVGKKADIIAVCLDSPHIHPITDMFSALCYSIQANDVVMTMVDGKVLYDNGEYTTIDFDKVKFEIGQRSRHLLNAR